MNYLISGVFSCFVMVCVSSVTSKSMLKLAISERADTISLDSPNINPTKPNISSFSAIRKNSKQDEEEAETNTPTESTSVGDPLQVAVNAVVYPGIRYAATAILKAVASPFEYITKQVNEIANPSTSTIEPPITQKADPPVNNVAPVDTTRRRQQSQGQVTYVVISPDQQSGAVAPGSAARATASPVVAAAPERTTVSKEEQDEEDEEESDNIN